MTKRNTRALASTLLLAIVFLAGRLSASGAPGQNAFTPTRLQWAALELTARYGSSHGAYALQFVALDDGTSVEARVTWTRDKEDLSRSLVRGYIKTWFEEYRETSGWSWLRLRLTEVDRSGPIPGASPAGR